MSTSRCVRITDRRFLTFAFAAVLMLAACGGSDDSAIDDSAIDDSAIEDADTTTLADGQAANDDQADAEAGDAAEDADGLSSTLGEDCSAGQAPNPEQVYSVSNIPANDPDGGLVARRLPGSDEPTISVLPDGTIVDIFAGDDCVVAADGSVWWFVNTPLLATGGYVNAAFLAGQSDLGQETDGNAVGGGEDDFDVTLVQVDCVYNGAAESCDLLTLSGFGSADDNYGLGNGYSMAPSGFLAEDCLVAFDPIACAELDARGPGGDLESIGTSYITAYQAGDVAAQEALSGERNTAEINSTDLTAGQQEFGLASANFFGTEISWIPQPTLAARCIVTEGLVQYCVITGD